MANFPGSMYKGFEYACCFVVDLQFVVLCEVRTVTNRALVLWGANFRLVLVQNKNKNMNKNKWNSNWQHNMRHLVDGEAG